MDEIEITIHARKMDAFKSFDEAAEFMKKRMKETGEVYSIIGRFEDVWYVCPTPFEKSATSREDYFK